LPIIENYPELMKQDSINYEFPPAISDYGRYCRGDRLPGDYSYQREYEQGIITGCQRTNHSADVEARFRDATPGRKEKVSRFHKLVLDGQARTLLAGTDRSRGQHTAPRPIHLYLPRCITVREAARLHGYPDWFRFNGQISHGFRQIGNSVPPLLGRAIASEIIKSLGITPEIPAEILLLNQDEFLRLTPSQASNFYGVPTDQIAYRNKSA
jgi:DNA (cytosine-5)-methyltransferase 1